MVTATNSEGWLRLAIDRDAISDDKSAHAAADKARGALFDSLAPFVQRGARMTMDHTFLLSASNRAFGLHDAVVREAEHDNPHAALILLQSMLDLVLVLLQVRRDPTYAAVVMDVKSSERQARGPLGAQKLLANARAELPDMKDVWDELSDVAHFGREGFVLTISDVHKDDDGIHVSVSTEPGWRDPLDKRVAIVGAALTEIAAAIYRKIFTDRPVGPPLND